MGDSRWNIMRGVAAIWRAITAPWRAWPCPFCESEHDWRNQCAESRHDNDRDMRTW